MVVVSWTKILHNHHKQPRYLTSEAGEAAFPLCSILQTGSFLKKKKSIVDKEAKRLLISEAEFLNLGNLKMGGLQLLESPSQSLKKDHSG